MKKAAAHYVRMATDICVFRGQGEGIEVLLIQRSKAPFKGCWALPGGRLEADETLDQCAARELQEETGLCAEHLLPFANFSEPQRDPRERTVSAAYVARVAKDARVMAGSDALVAEWFSTLSLPVLAFDHELILKKGLLLFQKRPCLTNE